MTRYPFYLGRPPSASHLNELNLERAFYSKVTIESKMSHMCDVIEKKWNLMTALLHVGVELKSKL